MRPFLLVDLALEAGYSTRDARYRAHVQLEMLDFCFTSADSILATLHAGNDSDDYYEGLQDNWPVLSH